MVRSVYKHQITNPRNFVTVLLCSSACIDCKLQMLGSNIHCICGRETVIRKVAPKSPLNIPKEFQAWE